MNEGKKSIAILYIATGPYIAFWNNFFDSFEKYFLKETEVHYYVFTDAKTFYNSSNSRVHIIEQKAEPWPLPTLLKFHRFLEIRDELIKYDYIYQSNANIICTKAVKEADFLPQINSEEKLMFTLHPGFYNRPKYEWPYDRNKQSGAYVPFNKGDNYVFGAMNGGCSKEYIDFISELNKGITEDLKNNRIALWHDESWVNKSIIGRRDYRLLHPGFCYPVGFEVPYEKIISGVSKMDVFDVKTFKGDYDEIMDFKQKICREFRKYSKKIIIKLCYIKDSIFNK